MCRGTAQPRVGPAPHPRSLPPAAARDARPRRVCRVSCRLMSEPAPGSAGRERNRAQPSLSRCSPAVGGLLPPASRREGAGPRPIPPWSHRGNLHNFPRPGSRHSLPWPSATLPATSRRRRLRTAQVSGPGAMGDRERWGPLAPRPGCAAFSTRGRTAPGGRRDGLGAPGVRDPSRAPPAPKHSPAPPLATAARSQPLPVGCQAANSGSPRVLAAGKGGTSPARQGGRHREDEKALERDTEILTSLPFSP